MVDPLGLYLTEDGNRQNKRLWTPGLVTQVPGGGGGGYSQGNLPDYFLRQYAIDGGHLALRVCSFYFLFPIFYFFFSALTLYGFSAITAKLMVLGPPNLGQGSTLMMSWLTLKIKVIGQMSRSRGQKTFLFQHSAKAKLDRCLSMQIEPSVQHAFR